MEKYLYTHGANGTSKITVGDNNLYSSERALFVDSYLIELEIRAENPNVHDIKTAINYFHYDENGRLSTSEEYIFNTHKNVNPTDSIIKMASLYKKVYTCDNNSQVLKQIISYHDSCIDSEEVIDYNIGESGFLIETKAKKDVKNKCIY